MCVEVAVRHSLINGRKIVGPAVQRPGCAARRNEDGSTLIARSDKNGEGSAGVGEKAPPPRRWTRGSDSGSCQDLPDLRGGAVPHRPASWKLPVPGTDWLR